MAEEEWLPALIWAGEQANLEAEARRLAALTRCNADRARQAQARRDGWQCADEWLEQADAAREQRNGHRTYPEELSELAALASQLPRSGPRRATRRR